VNWNHVSTACIFVYQWLIQFSSFFLFEPAHFPLKSHGKPDCLTKSSLLVYHYFSTFSTLPVSVTVTVITDGLWRPNVELRHHDDDDGYEDDSVDGDVDHGD